MRGGPGTQYGSIFERDKNHVSIPLWSCGNESYAGTCIQAMADFFQENDPAG